MDALENLTSNFLTISLLLLLSYAFLFRHSLFQATVKLPPPSTWLRCFLTLLVIAHTLHTLQLLLSPPTNLFTLLNLPLTAPVSAIRVAFLEHQKGRYPVGFQNKIPPDVETLLTRLASFEARVIYVRYGPYPLSQCAPCIHLSDFALFALAPTVLPYLRALILVSLLTSRPANRPAWRTPSLVVLSATFFTEVWWTADGTVPFRDGQLNGWTHTHTYLARYTILLLLPLFVHHFPAHSSPSALPPFITVPATRPPFPHQSSDFRLANGGVIPQTPQRARPALSRSQTTPGFSQAGPSTPNTSTLAQPQSSPFTTLNGALSSLNTTISTLHVLEWARLAGLRRQDLREQISNYHAAADVNAVYARSDEVLLREAERLGMGYQDKGKERKHEGENSSPRPRFGGRSKTWRGNGDPRELDGDSAVNDDELGSHGDGVPRSEEQQEEKEERERLEEEETELATSPLRAKARKAARELAQTYLMGPKATPNATRTAG